MFKYRLVGDNDYTFDIQGTLFKNRGINDIDAFLSLSKDVTHDYRLLKNIDKAVECLERHLELKSNILIIVDPDTDGYTSAAIMYQYIKLIDNNAKLEYALHNDKKHGFDNISIPDNIDLVIVPDSGSNDFKHHKSLKEKGIDIIILDHHEIDYESHDAIVVNTLLGDYPNHQLSGAGVVYKFCQALDELYWSDYADRFLDLVALGNIADSMSMMELETRYYVQQGLRNIKNVFFKTLVNKQEYSTKGKMNTTNVNFYISPLINAVIRVGEMSDKEDMFKSFIGMNYLVDYTPRGKDKDTIQVPLTEDMARRCANIKAKQGRMVEKVVNEVEKLIVNDQLNNNKVIFIHQIKNVDGGLTGLIANKIADSYKKPTILLSHCDDKGYFKGSARGYDKSKLKDFKEVVLQSDLFEWAKGHANAYGLCINKEKLTEVNTKLNESLESYTFEDEYEVDFEIPGRSLNKDIIFEISELVDVWGKGVEEPYILIKDIQTSDCDVLLQGKNEDTITIYLDDIKLIKFKSSKKFYEEIINSKTIDVLGRANINEYNDNQYPQVNIEAINIYK
ncbi:DHH family phosphoesterase [Fictibacillus nanhaiensis]|uniref:DHH family phosphoesterase n=1 Tax=Fictibacillus nanhaiensis TaxID=742169 RepID=UPI002E1A0985|nr:DHH family phosphoesterase [Fictibacillus nanhaiensis]